MDLIKKKENLLDQVIYYTIVGIISRCKCLEMVTAAVIGFTL